MQLRKSLAAKAKVGGKVASMVQKLQRHHTEKEKMTDYIMKEEAFKVGAEEPPMDLFVSSAQSNFQEPPPPPPPPPPLPSKLPQMSEEIVAPTGTLSSPRIDTEPEYGENLQPSAAEQENTTSSESTSHVSFSTSQTASTNSTYPTTMTKSIAASRNTGAPTVEAQDIEDLESEKNDMHSKLQRYEADFVATHGREVETYQDLEPVAHLYRRYLTVKKEVARRNKKKLSSKCTKNSTSFNPHHSSEGASSSLPLDRITETFTEREETTEEVGSHGLGEIVVIEPSNKVAATSNMLAPKKRSKQKNNDSDVDTVVAAVVAILDNDRRHKVGDPGDIVLIDEEENGSFYNAVDKKDDDSIASEPSRIIVAQPFDEVSTGNECFPSVQPSKRRREGGSNATTPERSNKAKGRNALPYNKGSPAGVASFSVEETPQRLGARPMVSADDALPEPEGPPPLLSVVSSASSSGILHISEAGSPPPPPASFRSSSRTVPMASPWSACLADDTSILSAQFTTSIGSADDHDDETYCTPAIVRIRQTASCSQNVPRSRQHRSITDIFTCKPRDEEIRSIDSEGPPDVCKSDACKAPTAGTTKEKPYSSKPMPIDEANSFIVNINEKSAVPREEEQMTDITFPSFPEVETWSNMVDDMMKTLEEDVAAAKETIASLPDQSQNSDPLSSAVSDKLKADASASKMTLMVEELDSLKAEFESISKELALSNGRLKQLEVDIEERDQAIATLQLERDLAQADVTHLQDKLRRLEQELKETNATNRKKMKAKDAKIALLNNTIEKLKQELDAVNKRMTTRDNRNHDLPPTMVSSTKGHESEFLPESITAKPSKTGSSPSPLHLDDELEYDTYTSKSIDGPIHNELMELSRPTLPPKADQKYRAIDTCQRNNRLASDSPISISSNDLELSESSSSLQEALAFVRTISASQAMKEALKDATKDNIHAVEEKTNDDEAIPRFSDKTKEVSYSVRLLEAPSEETNQDNVDGTEERCNRECAELATEYCCVQEASNVIQSVYDDCSGERTD